MLGWSNIFFGMRQTTIWPNDAGFSGNGIMIDLWLRAEEVVYDMILCLLCVHYCLCTQQHPQYLLAICRIGSAFHPYAQPIHMQLDRSAMSFATSGASREYLRGHEDGLHSLL